MKRVTIEIKAAEGGNDSKLFTGELANAYTRMFLRNGWQHRVVRERRASCGFHEIAFEITGDGLEVLTAEAGGHRIQRVSPTEKRGRVHTSTVTVAVLSGDNVVTDERYLRREASDFKIEWFSGTGCGGQHRNRHMNSCRVVHIPTGIIRTAQTRSRQTSEREAMRELLVALNSNVSQEYNNIIASDRRQQVGSGMRGDKIRTIRFQDDHAIDHRTGKHMSAVKYMRGFMDNLWH